MASVVKKVRNKISIGIMPANNHYAGFGPAIANESRKKVGLEPVVWKEIKQAKLD